MELLINIAVILIALLHIYILVLEVFLWTESRTRKIFGITNEQAQLTKTMASNQGVYNGFLAAGLLWSLITPNQLVAIEFKFFFLACVFLAGLYGSVTVHKRIIFIQALPAFITLVLLSFNYK